MKICKICSKTHTRKVYCSKKCYWESLKGIKGENAPNYKKVVGKSQAHKWLGVHYKKDKCCENPFGDCRATKDTWYDWALKKGRKYLRKRENYLILCRSCHRRYDLKKQKKLQAIKNLKLYNPYYGTKRIVD